MIGTGWRRGLCAALALAALAASPPLLAQEAARPPAAGNQEAVANAVARSGRLAFLYFLASRNDYTRLSAEIEKLKTEDPSWTPPPDLFEQQSAARTGVDDTRFWEAYSRGDLVTAKREMEILKRLAPSWRFPADAVDLTRAWAAFERGDYAATRREIDTIRAFHDDMEVEAADEILDLIAEAESGSAVSRFWAAYRKGDLATAKREMAVLQRVQPSWRFPPDAVDVTRAWAAYNRRDYAAARRELETLKAFHEGWEPPADLLQLLENAEVGREVAAALKRNDWQQIIRLQERHPRAFGCDTPDSAWAHGRALWNAGQRKAAAQAFVRLVDTCENADIRVASILVAQQFEDLALLDDLIARERPKRRPQVAERTFGRALQDREAMRTRLAARRDAAVEQALYSSDTISPDQLEATMAQARAQRSPKLALAVGWNAMGRKDYGQAAEWFDLAMQWGNSPDAARGLILALIERKQLDRAISLAKSWSSRSPEIAALLPELDRQRVLALDPQKDAAQVLARLRELGGSVADDPSVRMHRGWALVALKRYPEAQTDFAAVMRDGRATVEQKADAQGGAALVAAIMGNTEDAARLATALPEEKQAATRALIEFKRATNAYEQKRYQDALVAIARHRQLVPGDTSLDVIEAWALFRLERYPEARQRFRALKKATGDPSYEEAIVLTVKRQLPDG